MKKITTTILGLSLLTTTMLFAGENNHTGDHMHNGKMDNHSKTSMSQSMPSMDHSNMDMKNMSSYHNRMITGKYKVSLSSEKPLITGNNTMDIKLMVDGKPVTNAKVKIKFFMPEMPGMPYMEFKTKGKLINDKYKVNVNLSMSGTWQYQLKFKTEDGKIYKTRGSVNI